MYLTSRVPPCSTCTAHQGAVAYTLGITAEDINFFLNVFICIFLTPLVIKKQYWIIFISFVQTCLQSTKPLMSCAEHLLNVGR